MSSLDPHIQCQISDLSEACMKYWELRGIARDDRKEMQIELEQHFIQAAMDGKSLKVVIGPHPAAFAEAWAREMHPSAFRGGGLILPGVIYALGVVSTTALFEQLFTPTPSFTLTLFTVYLLTSSGLLALLIPLGGFLAPRIKTRQGRATLLFAVVVLTVLVLREAGMRVNWSTAILNWSWPLTLGLFGLAAFLYSLDYWWVARRERASSDHHLLLVPSVMKYLGRVALFDMLLLVGSVVVFNACTLVGRLV